MRDPSAPAKSNAYEVGRDDMGERKENDIFGKKKEADRVSTFRRLAAAQSSSEPRPRLRRSRGQ